MCVYFYILKSSNLPAHHQAGSTSKLHSSDADAARRAMDQHALASHGSRILEESLECSAVGHVQGGALLVADKVGQLLRAEFFAEGVLVEV